MNDSTPEMINRQSLMFLGLADSCSLSKAKKRHERNNELDIRSLSNEEKTAEFKRVYKENWPVGKICRYLDMTKYALKKKAEKLNVDGELDEVRHFNKRPPRHSDKVKLFGIKMIYGGHSGKYAAECIKEEFGVDVSNTTVLKWRKANDIGELF